ncbi:MAG: response regulator [Erysipelotrichaceae bacterium]|nr:response regulator [Erysipelotrichaceae bacterium]
MKYTILVMDDEPLIRRGISKLLDLKTLNIDRVLEAANGQEALSILENNEVDIILSDINTPKMNGLDFSKIVKERYPKIMIALITGYDYLDYAINALRIGVDDYLLKPVSKNDITQLLAKLIKKIEAKYKEDLNIIEETELDLRSILIKEIEDNLANPDFNLTCLANSLGYNMSYLSLQFKKLIGENFREFLLSKRLEKAKLLLLVSDYKIFEVSNKVGILDENYFARCFKRKYGCTCNEFRKQKL